jgi:desulfoferrodoxin (superoxide reductase-like protein)
MKCYPPHEIKDTNITWIELYHGQDTILALGSDTGSLAMILGHPHEIKDTNIITWIELYHGLDTISALGSLAMILGHLHLKSYSI